MLWLCEYIIFIFFRPQNTQIILKFIGQLLFLRQEHYHSYMYNKHEQKITDLNDVFFWPVDGILFREHPFSSSSNNHLTWQRSISLCSTYAPSPKYLDGSAPHFRRSRHYNLMERNPGVKIKVHFQRHIALQLFIRIHQILYQFSEICSLEISQKTIRNLFKGLPCCFLLLT